MSEVFMPYQDLKAVILTKGLLWQYYDDGIAYQIWAVDYATYKAIVVHDSSYQPIGGTDAADTVDFENNYKASANLPVFQNQQAVIQPVAQNYGATAWVFSHLFTDKTTWFGDAIRVTNETLGTGDGTTTTFNFANQYLIDMCHGKITGEDYVVPTAGQGGTDFFAHITVAGNPMTETPFASSAADYTVDYAAGTITFTTAPSNGDAIVATQYFYSPPNSGSTMYIRPMPGKKLIVTKAEAQFSADLVMTTQLNSAIYSYNPGLGAPPAKFLYPGSQSAFKRMWDFVNWTEGAWPPMPPFGGTRGYAQTSYQLTFPYLPAMTLDDAYGVEMRVWLTGDIPFTGECGQITFYAYRPN